MIMTMEEALEILKEEGYAPPPEALYQASIAGMPVQEFWATQCYLEKQTPMPTWEHVYLLLDIMFYPEKYGYPHFFTILYSTIKKSIKTALSGMIGRWVCETWPGEQECICLASDAEQAKGRGYEAFRKTVEKHPNYDANKRMLFGPNGEPLWKVTDRNGEYFPDGSVIKPVSMDYAGEAGANPTAIFITEAWTWKLEKHRRFYAEMTIPPTRPKGFRFMDTYAGYRGESNVLWDVWQRLQDADRVKQIKADEPIGILWNKAIRATAQRCGFPEPDTQDPPIYIDIPSRTIGYIDQGIQARRFPWQLGEQGAVYYQQEEAGATSVGDWLRLHFNEWAEPVEALMPIQWWDNCEDKTMRDLKPREAVVVSADASVTHDCTAMVMHSRCPNEGMHHEPALRKSRVWDPKMLGGKMDYDATILPQLVEWSDQQNIVEVAYDTFQLDYLMERVRLGRAKNITMPNGSIRDLPALNTRAFSQMNERRESDSNFVIMVRDRKYHHDGTHPEVRDHILQAAGMHDTHENTKLKIVKRDDTSQIDLVVACSMGAKRVMAYGL
jgi:hypothetical protein